MRDKTIVLPTARSGSKIPGFPLTWTVAKDVQARIFHGQQAKVHLPASLPDAIVSDGPHWFNSQHRGNVDNAPLGVVKTTELGQEHARQARHRIQVQRHVPIRI